VKGLSPRAVRGFLKRVQDVAADRSPAGAGPSWERLGAWWREQGLRPGDPVLLALPNSVRFLEQFFGVLAGGGVPVPVAPHTPSARLLDLMRTLGARALAATHVPRGIPGLERHDSMDRTQVGWFAPAGAPTTEPGEVILLTSGTSGFASGCVFGLEALLLNAQRHAAAIGQTDRDTVLVNLPLHFSFALVAQALATLVSGGRLLISGPPFQAPAYVRTIATHGVTVSSLTPVLARPLLLTRAPLPPCLRALTIGGDTLPPADVAQLLSCRPGGELYLTYGLTQAGPRVSTLAAHREPPRRHGSVGLPLTSTRVWLEPVQGGGGMQELMVSSETIMRRRIGLVEGRRQDDLRPDGAIATGDAFEQDADGYLHFRGRLSDFIVRRGEKICLTAVRRVAAELPHVRRATTQVVTRDDGSLDFDLTLATARSHHPGVEEYRALLGRLCCRSELPRCIHVVHDDGPDAEYK
jgi:long-chain acyl-CoA synthetase